MSSSRCTTAMGKWIRWRFSEPVPLRVELVRGEKELMLEKEVARLKEELEKVRADYANLEVRYGYEVTINGELVDLLKEHKIKFRPALEAARRRW